MKFLSSMLILCLSISSFSQNSKVNGSKNLLDANGFPKSHEKQSIDVTDFVSRNTEAIDLGYNDTRSLTELNSSITGEGYPWISSDGLRLYYLSGEGAEQNMLYYTERANVDSPFQAPILAPITVTAPLSIWLSENELDAYVTTFNGNIGKLLYYHRNSTLEPFNTFEEILLNGISLGFISAASLNAAQNELLLFSADYGTIIFTRTSANSFDYVEPLLSTSNLNATPGQISKDDLTYFLGIKNLASATLINQLERSNTSYSFSLSDLIEISSLNSPTGYNIQPSMSSNLEWVVFVRNAANTWQGNDLYISHSQALSTQDYNLGNNFTVFPNPSSGKFAISKGTTLNSNEDYSIAIYDATGKLLLKKAMATEIDLTDYAAGIYFAKITGATFSEIQKIIRN
jgi:Secretion system C-terminal sorting domain